jgi:chemotaxis signal transduction protein
VDVVVIEAGGPPYGIERRSRQMSSPGPGAADGSAGWEEVLSRLAQAARVLASRSDDDAARTAARQARAQRLLAETEAAHDATAPIQIRVLHFEAAGRPFAIDTRWVIEVARPSAIRALPAAPPFFVGVAALRGELLALIDILAWLDDRPDSARLQAGPTPWLIALGEDEMELGIVVDRVEGVDIDRSGEARRRIHAERLLADPRLLGGTRP